MFLSLTVTSFDKAVEPASVLREVIVSQMQAAAAAAAAAGGDDDDDEQEGADEDDEHAMELDSDMVSFSIRFPLNAKC